VRAVDAFPEGTKDPFPGLVTWQQQTYDEMSYGEIIEFFEELASRDNPFADYPVVFVKPKR